MTTTANFALQEDSGEISGQVTDAHTSLPIGGATVNILQGSQLIASTLTDSSGNYLISDLAPGSYTINPSATHYQSAVSGATVVTAQIDRVNLALQPFPGQLIGQVTNASTSAPIPGATITVTQGLNLNASVVTDANGDYVVNMLAPGTYTITASANLFASVTQGAIIQSNVVSTDNFALQEDPGEILGHVSDAATNNPIQGATVNLLQGAQLCASTLTDSSGNYLLSNLAPGNYIVNVSATNYQTSTEGTVVRSHQTTVDNFSQLSQPGTIIGQVTDQVSGTPIPDAIIDVLQGTTLIGSAITDANGNYSIPSLAPGDYMVNATAPNFQIVVHDAAVQSNQTTVVTSNLPEAPGTLYGSVLNAANNFPVSGANVSIFNGSVLIASTLTDSNGNYDIASLAPGSYSMTVSAVSYHSVTKSASVQVNLASILNFLLVDPPLPPATLSAQNHRIMFLTQTNHVQRLTWTASPSPNIVQYFIYRNGVRMGTVGASTFVFDMHNVNKSVSATYSITSFNSFGQESAPINIVL